MSDESSGLIKKLIPVVIALAILGLIIFGAIKFFGSLSQQVAPPNKPTVLKIKPVPPPPPPPPPEEEPPPPEEEPEIEEPEEEEPEPEPEDSPEPDQADDLDAATDDLVSEGAVGDCTGPLCLKKGRAGCTLNCGKGGKGAYKRFGGKLGRALTRILSNEDAVRTLSYNVLVEVWISDDGRIERANLVEGTGDSDTDQALELALSSGKKTGLIPPAGMPQPVKIRVDSRL